MIVMLGCIVMSGCTSDKTEETLPVTETVAVTMETIPETTQPAETADPELEAGFVAVEPETEESVPPVKDAEEKNDVQETVPPTTEARWEDPGTAHIPNMGDLIP